jgi:hypothetical protein
MDLYIEKEPAVDAVRRLIRVALGMKNFHRLTQMSVVTNAGNTSHDFQSHQTAEAQILGDEWCKTQLDWLGNGRCAELTSCTLTIHFNPQNNNKQCSLSLHRGPIYDKIQFHSGDINIAMRGIEYIVEKYPQVADEKRRQIETAIVNSAPSDLLTEVTRRLTESAVDLRAATKEGLAQFLSGVTAIDKEITEKLHVEYAKHRTEIEAQRVKLQADAEEQRKRDQEEIEAEWEKLRDERAKFEIKRKKLDDRRSTHVRREIFKELESKLAKQTKVELSAETNKKLWPIWIVCGVVAAGAIALGAFGGYLMLTQHQELGWMAIAPFSSGVIVFGLNAIYFVRFANAWLARHADLETRNQLLQFDMARASWFTEMLFEYKDAKSGTVPESVIRVMTKNLFELRAGADDRVKHPVDDVAAFLERVNRIRLAEGEVEMDAAGKEQVKKK